MPLSTADVSFDVSDLGGVDFDARRTKVYATANTSTVVDTDGNHVFLGSTNATVGADGTGTLSVPIPGAGSNPESWQTTIHVDYPDRNADRGRRVQSFGPFTITASANLADLVAEMPVQPEYASEVFDRLDALEAGGGGGDASDSAIAALVADEDSETHAAVIALTGDGASVDPGYDVVLVVGQSNASGRGIIDTLVDVRDNRVWQYGSLGAETNRQSRITTADEPLGHADYSLGDTALGPANSFASWYADANPGRKVLLVPAAYGGTGFSTSAPNNWQDVSGSLYRRAITQANAAMTAAGTGARLAAIIWVQGEADIGMTAAAYRTALDALIVGLRTSITGATTAPFIIGRMVPAFIASGAGATAIDGVHVDTPNRLPKVLVVAGPPGNSDGIHYTAASYRTLGRAMSDALNDAAPTPTGVGILTPSSITDTGFTLTVSGATGDLAALPYSFSTDDGSTWSAYQSSPVFSVTGKSASTAYQCKHRVKDAGGTVVVGTAVTATTAGAANYASVVLADAPTVWWRLGETSGTTAADSSGNGHAGTYLGSPALGVTGLVTGDTDKACEFDGTDDRVTVAWDAWMTPTSESFSAEAIIKPAGVTGNHVIIGRMASPANVWMMRKDGTNLVFHTSDSSYTVHPATGVTFVAGTRYHVACTYDHATNTKKLYLNGTQVASSTAGGTPALATTALHVGGNPASGAETFDGVIDEAAYYAGTVLTAADFLEHAQKAGIV